MSSVPQKRTLGEVIRRHVRAGLADTHVSLPARVTRVDLSKNLVDAQPLLMDIIEQPDGERVAQRFPVITNVPIQVANGGGFRITFPVVVGDVVALVFSDRCLDRWLASGDEVDPVDPREHALSDAVVAIPSTNPSAPWTIRADAACIGKEGGPQIVLKAGEISLDDGTKEVARKGDKSKASTAMALWMGQVEGAINAIAAGSVAPLSNVPLTGAAAVMALIDAGADRVKA